jgi:hypothetical protein
MFLGAVIIVQATTAAALVIAKFDPVSTAFLSILAGIIIALALTMRKEKE